MTAQVEGLFVYPVKGLSAQPLESLTLEPGEGVPGDRMWGFARYNSGFDPANPKPLPKNRFVVLMTQAALAGVRSNLTGDTLVMELDGQREAFDIFTDGGRQKASRFLHEGLGLTDPEPATLVSAHPHRFTDVSVTSAQMMQAVSLMNLDSVQAFADQIGRPVDPARFRANVTFSGLPAWSELEATGREVHCGEVRFRVLQRTRRCPATEVDPVSAERDMPVPALLKEHAGHEDMGVYAEVITGGTICPGDAVKLV